MTEAFSRSTIKELLKKMKESEEPTFDIPIFSSKVLLSSSKIIGWLCRLVIEKDYGEVNPRLHRAVSCTFTVR
jgi:hypothetical protein